MEDLKKLIEARAEAAYTYAKKTVKETKFDTERRSMSILDRILRSLQWELFFSTGFSFICIAIALSSGSKPVIIFLSLLIAYSLGFTIYLSNIYKDTKNQIFNTGTIRSSVTGTIRIIKNFTRLYTRFSTSFVPAIFIAAFLAGFIEFMLQNNPPASLPWFSIAIGSLISFTWIMLAKWFTKWWMNRLYGNYLGNLIKHLDELDAEN